MATADIPSIIARADQIGAQKSALANQATDQAISLANSIVVPRPQVADIEFTDPAEPNAPQDISGQVTSAFESARVALRAEMTQQFGGFFSQFFPIGSELSSALSWAESAITTGGSGVNINVENATWERARSKALRDAGRAEDEALTTWAARRYTVPPGALNYQLARIQTDAQGAIAEVGRDTAIETFKAELENIRLAVTTAVQARGAAMSAAADYVRVLALGPQVGIEYATQLTQAKMKAQELIMELYNLQISAEKTKVEAKSTVAEIKLKATDLELRGQVEKVTLAVQAAMAAAQSAGTQAAAALNAIHAQAGWNLNDSRDLTGTF